VTTDDDYADAAWSPWGQDRLRHAPRRKVDVSGGRHRTGATRLTHGEGNNENPRWSSDGRHWCSPSRADHDLTMRSDGTDVRRLTRGGDCFTPDWSHRVP
jgi:Tol biopolymer transport system component